MALNGLPILKFIKTWYRNNFTEEQHWDEIADKTQQWSNIYRNNFIQLGLDIGGSDFQYNGNGTKTQSESILDRLNDLENLSEASTVGLQNNLALSLSAGVFKVVGGNLAILSTSNVGTVIVQGSDGKIYETSFESDVYKFEDAASGSSDIVNENFGTLSGTAFSSTNFYGYVVYDTVNLVAHFAISRIPGLKSSPSSSNNIAYRGSPATTNSEDNFFFLTETNIKTTHANMPCVQVFRIRMSKSAGDDWTVATLNAYDNFGHDYSFQNVYIADNQTTTAQLNIRTIDSGATGGMSQFGTDSPSPAVSDVVYAINFFGRDSVQNEQIYSQIRTTIEDPTSASEDAVFEIRVVNGGALTTILSLSALNNLATLVSSFNFQADNFYIDATNNRIYEGATATTTIDSLDYQHQITVLNGSTPALALICTASGGTGVRQASWHNTASPADADAIWQYKIYGNNDVSAIKEYARIQVLANDVSAGTEDGLFYVSVMKAGTLTNNFLVYSDQVQVRPESLVVGTTTNVGPEGFNQGLYVKSTDSNRRLGLFESTDAGASAVIVDLYKNSASPAASDSVGSIRFLGNDSGGNLTTYASISGDISDPTNGSEDGNLALSVLSGGTLSDILTISGSAGTVECTFDNLNTVQILGDATTTYCLYVVADSLTTGDAVKITASTNSASDTVGIYLDGANAGAGDFIALDFGDLSTTEFVMEIPTDNTDPTGGGGAAAGRIKIRTAAGTTRYIPYY